jgi:hypothetical protein
MSDSGQLKKMIVEGYTSAKYDGSPADTFEVMFNPNAYSLKYEIEYHEEQGKGSSGSPMKYGKIKPREFTFEFIIDGTGASAEKADVSEEVEHFLEVAGKHDGDIHRPKYLWLKWGTLSSKCVLKSADISFNLFKPDGTPLRAKIAASFSENIEDTLRVAKERNSSPDLTHIRVVENGNSLPQMVYKEYRDHLYYLSVARANGLKNFRRLKPGTSIILPPVKNTNE